MTVSRTGGVSTMRCVPWYLPTFEELLFQLSLGDLDLDRLVDLLCMSLFVIGVVLDGRGEEGVDKGGLS